MFSVRFLTAIAVSGLVAMPVMASPAYAQRMTAQGRGAGFLSLATDGRRIFDHTPQAAGRYVGDALSCTNCHLASGKQAFAAPLWGAAGMYPGYQKKAGRVVTLSQRIQECFLFSERGTAPPLNGHTVRAIDAYAHYLAYRHGNVMVGYPSPGTGYVAPLKTTAGSVIAGRREFAGHCAMCHGSRGQGQEVVFLHKYAPPLWGSRSFAVGAGMGNPAMAARFIWANMPYGHGRTLSPQVARNIADFMDSQARPKPREALAKLWKK